MGRGVLHGKPGVGRDILKESEVAEINLGKHSNEAV